MPLKFKHMPMHVKHVELMEYTDLFRENVLRNKNNSSQIMKLEDATPIIDLLVVPKNFVISYINLF